jgi:hemolysin III
VVLHGEVMDVDKLSKDRSEHVTDEVFNSSSHMAAALFAVMGAAFLITRSAVAGQVWSIVSFAIYGASLFGVFLFSTLHHGVKCSPRTDIILRNCDYIAIFPLIAGSYTPICLILLRDSYIGWTIFGVVWAAAVVGIVLRVAFNDMPSWPLSTLYITMGWLGAFVAVPVYQQIGILGFLLFLGGGVFYTIGFVIYNIEKPNPVPGKFGFHEIWHIFVILGALAHYLMMMLL